VHYVPTSVTATPARSRMGAAVVALAVAAACSTAWTSTAKADGVGGVLDPSLPTIGTGLQDVVVSGTVGAIDAVRQAVTSVGGAVDSLLPIVDGVAARVPADRLDELSGQPGVTAVTADRVGTFSAATFDDTLSSSAYVHNSGAASVWSAAARGANVGVAVIDTGVTPVGDLAGRVVSGPDLSGENNPTRDSFGHGTVMAGIIAGSGAAAGATPRTGVAPSTNVVSVKVAGANGATDVSTVLAAMHWVASFKDTYDIEVLNLSWGVPSTQSPDVDPLNYSVQRLWSLGITVVVAAGNSGPSNGTITKPGDDPVVLTVGAYDDKGDTLTTNDSVPDWSSRGPTAAGLQKPDLVAPGRTLVSTRAPGSTVEAQNPKALVGADYIKGSGSSQAAAVTSGAAALLKAARPTMTPDQVKHALMTTATPIGAVAATAQGRGRINIAAANAADVSAAPVQVLSSTGMGSLEGSRGNGPRVTIPCDGATVLLEGERTAWCSPWNGNAWTGSIWNGNAWTGNAWTGNAWTGNAWTGNAWTNSGWTGNAWTGNAWTGNAWTGNAWTGNAWTGNAWTGNAWTGNAWTGSTFTSAEYDATEEGSTLLTAFWGSKVKFGKHVAGEANDLPDLLRHKDDRRSDR
jgi:serine protease AprX